MGWAEAHPRRLIKDRTWTVQVSPGGQRNTGLREGFVMLTEKPGILSGDSARSPCLQTEFVLGIHNMQGNEMRAFSLKNKTKQ